MDQINLMGVERRIDAVTASTKRIEQEVAKANGKIDDIAGNLMQVKGELEELRSSFKAFVEENIKVAVLQKAATELIRVRQELEQNFGNYKVVRETMLGVLQATDLALVKKTTISQVTEELMLSTPDYWLAPCLVAVSAWIGNDRDLAERAIAEAVKRDEEKTALVMALICRRNNRTATCFEWLSIYFNRQSAENFTESNFTYLNAYLNGVFGPDEKHMCEDYVAKWMREIQSNGEELEKKQTEQWHTYCKEFTVDLEGQFPKLNSCVQEYQDISAYISRINSVDGIANEFSQMKNVEVDQQKLKKEIDKTLITLISRYDTKEEPLRKEERYLQAIRYFDGDKEAAKAAILEEDRKRTEDTIDLISQMTNIIVKKENTRPWERKTSVAFLSSYIRNGFESYITEKKSTFPKKITLKIHGWTGTAENGNNEEALQRDYRQYIEHKREQALQAINRQKPRQLKIASLVLAIISIPTLFILVPMGLLGLGGAGVCFLRSNKAKKDIAQRIEDTNGSHDKMLTFGKQQIEGALGEWNEVQALVQNFESGKLPDIVA